MVLLNIIDTIISTTAIKKLMYVFSIVADVGLTSTVIQTAGAYRSHSESLATSLQFIHAYGRPYPSVNGTDFNLNITAFVAHRDCSQNTTSCGYGVTTATAPDATFQQGAVVGESLALNVTLVMYVPAQQCSETEFLCIQIDRGDGGLFVDPNIDNNVYCENITGLIICQPGMKDYICINICMDQLY